MIILYIIQSESYEHLQIFIPIPGDNVLCIVYILFSLGLYKVEIWQYIWYQGQEENWKKGGWNRCKSNDFNITLFQVH